ncbi:MAG: substrate-binding domain-containing protein, partial [Spirochaetaceae bacterium]|nr:substrate-binding domain-containing protein [Spirochaetaceae bacterium]
MKKGIVLWAALALLMLTPAMLFARAEAEDDVFEIATVVKITGIPWFNRMEVGVTRAAEELGVNSYQIGPADADPAQQVRMVEDLISKGVDAICVTPNDATALEPVFNRAREQG